MAEDQRLEVLKLIKADIVEDINKSEGEPFTGRNVHVLFGKQAAAIQALANIIETLVLKEVKRKENITLCEFYPMNDSVCACGSDISGSFVCTEEYSKKCQWAKEKKNVNNS
jgi:hypothetical protein